MTRYGLICNQCNWIESDASADDVKKIFNEHKKQFPNHTIFVATKESEWEQASPLGCPCLRFHGGMGCWIALKEEPCPTKKCNFSGCHNYGLPFGEKDRLKILNSNDEM